MSEVIENIKRRYQRYDDTLTMKNSQEQTMVFNQAVISVSRENTIVSTALIGREGTVKEYISAQDWNVDIAIILRDKESIYEKNAYPLDGVRKAADFLKAEEVFKVTNPYLSIFGITEVVIKTISSAQSTHLNQQTIQLTCLSDTPYILNSDI